MASPRDPTQFTRESAERIANVVRAAELGYPRARPLVFDKADDPPSRKVFRIATFTGEWPIGDNKEVTFKYQTNTPNTALVKNLFVPLESAPDGPADCAIAKEGTAWFLVNADHAASQIIVGTVFENWSVNASATVTQNNPDGTEMLDAPTFTVKNYIANLVLNGDSMRVICALVDDVWVLLAWDWTALENWSSSETQALGHTPGGGLKWINVAAC